MGNTLICSKDANCFECPYDDCIGEIRGQKKKPGRKRLSPEVLQQHKLEYRKKYNALHREEINRKNLESYYRKKNEKANS